MLLFSDVLLTADFDRTLTDTEGKIPQRNLDAIEYFMANGGTFTVNTGRSLPMTKVFRDIVPVSAPLLLYNGSAAYDPEKQDTHSGGSGCGCSASVLCAYILPKIRDGVWKRVLFVPTGALLSTVSFNEGQSVPGIAHAVILEKTDM